MSATVKWTVSEDFFTGKYAQKDPITNETRVYDIDKLTEKYVSFDPWPETPEQIAYVMDNCDDPYVIGALFVVALDHFEYKGLSDYSAAVYPMLDTLLTGAGLQPSFALSNFDKQHIAEFGQKRLYQPGGKALSEADIAKVAPKTFLKGATYQNGYMPESADPEDKTTWKIVVDEYPYCCDLESIQKGEHPKFFTVCPESFSLSQETESSELVEMKHNFKCRIGMKWNSSKQRWCPCDCATVSRGYDRYPLLGQRWFSNNYVGPVEDLGW